MEIKTFHYILKRQAYIYMLKKILLTMTLAFTVIFVSAQNQAEAQDVWVGTSPATGWDCYIMTETIKTHRGARESYSATLKMITNSGSVRYLDYNFWYTYEDGIPVYFSNSQGYSGRISKYDTPIEWQMYQVIGQYK